MAEPSGNSDDLSQTITDAAGEPLKAAGDEGSMEGRSLSDLIEADRYLASKRVAQGKSRGFKISKFVPPGTA